MVVPRPWCTKDPRTCVEVVGVTETLFSVVFGVLLVTLPFLMLDHDHEIDYIKQFHLGNFIIKDNSITPDKFFYALNITDIFEYDCNQVTESLRLFLDEYLKGKVGYEVSINRTQVLKEMDEKNETLVSTRILCEIHIRTAKNPRKDTIEWQGNKYSVANIAAQTISKYTGEKIPEVLKKFRVIQPESDQIAEQKIYPSAVGRDPERTTCIKEQILLTPKQEVLDIENLMYALMYTSAAISLIAGVLLTSTAFVVSRFLLMVTFLTEVASIALMAGGVLVANEPLLCLYQYGGISVYAADSPRYMQTIITYSCAAYAGSLKVYCLWFIAAYAEVASSLKDKQEDISPEYSKYVAKVAKEVDQKNQELGGDEAEIDSDDENEDSSDEHHNKTDESIDTGSPISKSQKSTDAESVAASVPPLRARKVEPKNVRRHSDSYSDGSSNGSEDSKIGVQPGAGKEGIGRGRQQQRQQRVRKYFDREHTIIPQNKDKNLFKQTFFGSHGS